MLGLSLILPLWFISIHGLGQKAGEFGAALIFFSLMIFGFIFSALGMIFGHDGDSDHGDFGHADAGHGDHDGGEHGQTPSKFGIRTILFFITGFGAVGFITQLKTQNSFISSIAGIVGGMVMSMICYYIIRLFYQQQATSIMTSEDIQGAEGEVITTIHKDGIGEVSVIAIGKLISKPAVSENGSEIKTGARIKVVSISGNRVVVKQI